MNEKNKYHSVAEAVRIEYNEYNGDVFIVFKITDERFKKAVKDDWTNDIDLRVIDKKLCEFDKVK